MKFRWERNRESPLELSCVGICNCKAIAIKCLSQPAAAGCDDAKGSSVSQCTDVGYCVAGQCNGTQTRPVVRTCNETAYTACSTEFGECFASAALSGVTTCSCYPKFLKCYNGLGCDPMLYPFHPTSLCNDVDECKGKPFCTDPNYVVPGQMNATCTPKALIDCYNGTYLLSEKYLNFGNDSKSDFFTHLRFIAAFTTYECNLLGAAAKCFNDNKCPMFATGQKEACLSTGALPPTVVCD